MELVQNLMHHLAVSYQVEHGEIEIFGNKIASADSKQFHSWPIYSLISRSLLFPDPGSVILQRQLRKH